MIKSLCVFHYGVAAFGGMPNLLFPLSISSSLDQSLPHTHKSQNPTITVWSAMGRARRNPYSWWQPVLSLAFTASVCISFPFLCLSLPVLYLSCYLLTWPSLWLLDLLPNIFLCESISSHIPGIFFKQDMKTTIITAVRYYQLHPLKSRDNMLCFTLSLLLLLFFFSHPSITSPLPLLCPPYFVKPLPSTCIFLCPSQTVCYFYCFSFLSLCPVPRPHPWAFSRWWQ